MSPAPSSPEIQVAEIVIGLHALGIQAGAVILVHSSLKSFGRVEGGADTVIDGLLETVGPTGTVLVPTLTGQRTDSPSDPPVFDVRETPCWTGLIPETFRRRPTARRSLHPTHSVAAIGPEADALLQDHDSSLTPCGKGSPYLRLGDRDGQVVFLGVTLEACTLLHGVEELAGCDYHMQSAPARATITDENGYTSRKWVRLHDWGTQRDFTVLEPIFLKAGVMQLSAIGPAPVRVLQVRPAIQLSLELLRQNPRMLCEGTAVSRTAREAASPPRDAEPAA